MLVLRAFSAGAVVKVWLCDEDGEPLRELQEPVAHLDGGVDWPLTVASCRVMPGQEGLEITLVPADPAGAGSTGESESRRAPESEG